MKCVATYCLRLQRGVCAVPHLSWTIEGSDADAPRSRFAHCTASDSQDHGSPFLKACGCYLEAPRHGRFCCLSVWSPASLRVTKKEGEMFILNCNRSDHPLLSSALFSQLPTTLEAPCGQGWCLHGLWLHPQRLYFLWHYFWMNDPLEACLSPLSEANVYRAWFLRPRWPWSGAWTEERGRIWQPSSALQSQHQAGDEVGQGGDVSGAIEFNAFKLPKGKERTWLKGLRIRGMIT